MNETKKEEPRNYNVWLKCFIKAMKESLRTGLRFYPRDDDVAMLKQIKALIQKPQVTEEWIEEKAIELNNEILLANYKESYYNMSKDFIRSLVEEISSQQIGKNGK